MQRRQKIGSSRREFLRNTAAAAAAATVMGPFINRAAWAASDLVRVACVGVGGKGDSDSTHAGTQGGVVVGICDVDGRTLGQKARQYPNAKTYSDFRKMLTEMEKSIDAVTVSTPDHCHGLAAAMAMRMGKHVYCQKPLTQTVYEARLLRQLASEKKLATQMGNQGSANSGLRRAVEILQTGLIGAPQELHVWSNRPIWPQGLDRPAGQDPVPATLDWDNWIGPAPMRPFKRGVYHTFNWRGWYDFGTGALGDMACHMVNMPLRALKLGYPNVVECELASRVYPETYPKTSRIRYEFPAREGLPPMKFWWYDGNPDDKQLSPLRPPGDVIKEVLDLQGRMPASGCVIVGDKGKAFAADDNGTRFYVMLKGEQKYVGAANHEAVKAIPRKFEVAPGPAGDDDACNKAEWFRAIRGGPPAYSNFDIAAYLTEIILLGCVALRVGEGVRMDWDGPGMKSPNVPEAAKFVKRESRKGWEL